MRAIFAVTPTGHSTKRDPAGRIGGMNPLKSLILEHLAKGDLVLSVFGDRFNVGITVRHEDGTESSYEVPGGEVDQNERWVMEATSLVIQALKRQGLQ